MSGQIPIGNEYPFALLIPKGRYFEVRTCVSLFSRFECTWWMEEWKTMWHYRL